MNNPQNPNNNIPPNQPYNPQVNQPQQPNNGYYGYNGTSANSQQPHYSQNYNTHYTTTNGDYAYSSAPVLDAKAMQTMKNAGQEKKELKRMGNLCGAAVLLYILFSYAVSVVISAFGVMDYYYSDSLVSSAVNILLSVFSVGLAFFIIGKKNKKNSPNYLPHKKMSGKKMAAYVLAGSALCYVANYINSIFVVFMSTMGFQLDQREQPLPNDFASSVLYIVSLALMPAIIEEYAIRGVVMQPLKKYSLRFAIVATAIVFGIMHGTLVQVPFAMMAGIALAWITIKTENIIPAMLVHFMNNGRSAVMDIIEAQFGQNASTAFFFIFTAVIVILGAVSLFYIYKDEKNDENAVHIITRGKQNGMLSPYEMTDAKRYKAFLLTPTMIIAFVIMLVQTATTVTYVGR